MLSSAHGRRTLVALAALLLLIPLVSPLGSRARAEEVTPVADGAAATSFTYAKFDPALCSVPEDVTDTPAYSRDDCGEGTFTATGIEDGDTVEVDLLGEDGTTFATLPTTDNGDGTFTFAIEPEAAWPAGRVGVSAHVGDTVLGTSELFLNFLTATVEETPKGDGTPYSSGEDVPVTGTIAQLDTDPIIGPSETGVPATFSLAVDLPDGTTRTVTGGPFTAAADGTFGETIPASTFAGVQGAEGNDFKVVFAVRVIDAAFDDAGDPWAAAEAGSGAVTIVTPPTGLILQNRYNSPVGWVKPGETYTYRVFVKNYTDTDATNVVVNIPAPPSSVFSAAAPFTGSGTANVQPDHLTWTIGTLPAMDEAPTVATLVIDANAVSLDVDPEVVWKDLSSTATLTYTGGTTATDTTHGPKVIPPAGGYETARYGDKPFPMVPVDYTDRSHLAEHSGDDLSKVVNDESFVGSTINLYKEMSYNQLFPNGTVPSEGIATADFTYAPGFQFSVPDRTEHPNCRGFTYAEDPTGSAQGSPLYPERIRDGWYQLPGNTEYYGGDDPVFTLGQAGSIDSACGTLGKGVYDAAQIADPEIDYNDFDFDHDGVVDFFMLIFTGCGGNGSSQLGPAGCPLSPEPYDNIWPHSASLEQQFTDPDTGLRGFISDDQLKNVHGTPQCWTSEARSAFDDCAADGGNGDDNLPVPVRVGPYNVNPETAIDSASVISHEFGHHLGLPDFYNQEDYNAYGEFNLMASDYSQHMTVFSKQDLGWVVPHMLQPGETDDVSDWDEIKDDIGEIHWETPDGTPYTLSSTGGDQNVHNGQAFGLKLPPREIIDPALVEDGASAPHVWWSGRGNDFGCTPDGGHNLDVYLPELADLPADTPVNVTFKSAWDIEWDFDYGFVMTTTDGTEYTSHPSDNGYSTASDNPNQNNCQAQYGNGITGQSGSYAEGTQTVDRQPVVGGAYDKEPVFLEDSYDISDLAGGKQPVLRFSYSTDPAFDRPGWFIDDIVVTAGGKVIYDSDFEKDVEEGRLFPGGCQPEGINVADRCTAGWNRADVSAGNPADHAYYLELRDQSGFDFNGHNQSERGDTSWDPGVFIEYTDEAHGYGNNYVPFPPAQHYLDSQPAQGDECPDVEDAPCDDASFTDASGDTHFDDVIDADSPGGWVDDFQDPSSPYGDDGWHFDYGCLSLDVDSMSGEGVGPEALPSDLTADATITALEGCEPFAYGSTIGQEAGDGSACPSTKVPPTPYADARVAAPHAENIACIGWYGITQGKGDINGDGKPDYDPNGSVTRGQMASFIARLALEAGVSLPANPPDAFADDNGTEHEPSINVLAALGIVEGRADGSYGAQDAVRRDQMASFIARLHEKATGTAPTSTRDWFTDDNGSVHESNINAIAELGITRGSRDVDGDGKIDYEPAKNVSRAQMASFIARELNVLLNDDVVYQGGAAIQLTQAEAPAGDDIAGTVLTNKRVESMKVSGCGLDDEDVTIGTDGGDFTVTFPADRETGPCTLTFEITTSRDQLNEDARPTQTVTHTISVLVS
jgi:M6 family metalloprotease-like protein/uncharacterized repeat protein (TIGR01451 family)